MYYPWQTCNKSPLWSTRRHSSLDLYMQMNCINLKHAAYYSWHSHCTDKDSMWVGCGKCYTCINDTLTLPMSILAVLHKLEVIRDELGRGC